MHACILVSLVEWLDLYSVHKRIVVHSIWSTLVCIQPSAHKDDKKKKKKQKKGKGNKKKDKKDKKEKKLTQEQKDKQAQKEKEKQEKDRKRDEAKQERDAISKAKKASRMFVPSFVWSPYEVQS